jgi:D-psicose/D-tagatose/L-ribulose 3-epimerase
MAISYGINTWTWVSPFTTENAKTLFPKIKEMGFDLVEVALEDPSHVDAEVLRDLLLDNGLGVSVCGAFGPSRDLTSDDPAAIQNSLDYIEQALDISATVGASVFAGPMYSAVGKARQVPPDQKKREFDMAVDGLMKAGILGEKYGITLAVEPLNRFETDLINTAAQARDLIDAIDSRAVKVHLDTFHMNIEEESVLDAIRLIGPDLAHVHASESNRGTPGMGLAAWDQLEQGLREVGYSGAVVIETFTPDVKEIARAAAIWRQLAPSQDSLATNGLAFLKDLFSRVEY